MPGRIVYTITSHFTGMLLADENILRADAVQKLETYFTHAGIEPVPISIMNDAFDLALQTTIGVYRA